MPPLRVPRLLCGMMCSSEAVLQHLECFRSGPAGFERRDGHGTPSDFELAWSYFVFPHGSGEVCPSPRGPF